MKPKKALLKAVRNKKQQEEVERMTDAQAADLLRNLNKKEDK